MENKSDAEFLDYVARLVLIVKDKPMALLNFDEECADRLRAIAARLTAPSVEEVPDADVEYCNEQAAEYAIRYNNAPMANRYERMARRLAAKLRSE